MRVDGVDQEWKKTLKKAGVRSRGFYVLRHQFRTVADSAGQPNLVRVIMGQVFPGMDEFYLHLGKSQQTELRAVVNRVRTWALGK